MSPETTSLDAGLPCTTGVLPTVPGSFLLEFLGVACRPGCLSNLDFPFAVSSAQQPSPCFGLAPTRPHACGALRQQTSSDASRFGSAAAPQACSFKARCSWLDAPLRASGRNPAFPRTRLPITLRPKSPTQPLPAAPSTPFTPDRPAKLCQSGHLRPPIASPMGQCSAVLVTLGHPVSSPLQPRQGRMTEPCPRRATRTMSAQFRQPPESPDSVDERPFRRFCSPAVGTGTGHLPGARVCLRVRSQPRPSTTPSAARMRATLGKGACQCLA